MDHPLKHCYFLFIFALLLYKFSKSEVFALDCFRVKLLFISALFACIQRVERKARTLLLSMVQFRSML